MSIRLPLLLSFSLLLTNAAFATNGDNMIGFGAVSRSMGGTGIALPMGPESALKNPALLTHDKTFEFSFAGTYFAPQVESKNENRADKTIESDADTFMIPAIGFTYAINKDFTFGMGAFGTSGLGVDYRDSRASSTAAQDDGLFKMATSLTLMKFSPSLAYQWKNLLVGVRFDILYGSLGISYDQASAGSTAGSQGAGTSDDLGFGYDLGLGYAWENFTFGVNYQAPIKMEYKKQLTDSAADFGASSVIGSDELEQPAEIGLGVAYTWNALTVTADYKMIQWEDAEGYKSFGWDNQDVYSLGLQYALKETKIRAGFNYAKSPLQDNAINRSKDMMTDGQIHVLNLIGFPAIIDKHFTLGVGHEFNKNFGMDFAATYSPEVTEATQFNGQNFETKHSQYSTSLAMRWNY